MALIRFFLYSLALCMLLASLKAQNSAAPLGLAMLFVIAAISLKHKPKANSAGTSRHGDHNSTGTVKKVTAPTQDYQIPNAQLRTAASVPTSSNQPKLIPHTESVKIGPFTLSGPIYVGARSDLSDPAVIFPLAALIALPPGEPLGYYPCYSGISAAHRYGYLQWLSDRRDVPNEIGYAFLYLYGFERYILVEAINGDPDIRESEVPFILGEIERLCKLIPESSFQTYAIQLRDLILIEFFPDLIDSTKGEWPTSRSLAMQFVVAKHSQKPDTILDADWALQWVLKQGGFSNKLVRENYQTLRRLFRAAYERLPNGGITVPDCAKRYTLEYHSASRGFGPNKAVLLKYPTLANPIALKTPVRKLTTVYESIYSLFPSVTRAISRNNAAELLRLACEHPELWELPEMQSAADRLSRNLSDTPWVAAGTLLEILSMKSAEKLSPSTLAGLSIAIQATGRVLVPTVSLTPATLKSDDNVTTYPGTTPKELSSMGTAIVVAINLGMLVAAADGNIHELEIKTLEDVIRTNLSGPESEYLSAYLLWRHRYPTGTTGLKKQLESLTDDHRHFIAQILADVAMADNQLTSTEIKQFEKLIVKLGLEASEATQLLHRRSSASSAPVFATKPTTKNPVTLNLAAIQAHQQATIEAQSVLSAIFQDALDESSSPDASMTADEPIEKYETATSCWHNGQLDVPHAQLAEWLLQADERDMAEIEAKCAEVGLMSAGALNKINDVAFETLGDALLDISDTVAIYRDLLPA